jgi:hypothetical protein
MVKTRKISGADGYTFPLMLVLLSALAFGASRLESASSYRVKRDKEEELLFRGRAYMEAIRAFSAAEATDRRYPRKLEELVSDPRRPGRRFIRQLYKDPMTGTDFTVILSPDGTIAGVASASTDIPFRKVDFDKALAGFEKARTYADWRFSAKPSLANSTVTDADSNPAGQPATGPSRP